MENATISNTELYAVKDKFDNVSKELEKINKNYSDLITKIIKNNKLEELQKIFDIIEHFKKERKEILEVLSKPFSSETVTVAMDNIDSYSKNVLQMLSKMQEVSFSFKNSTDESIQKIVDELNNINVEYLKSVNEQTKILEDLLNTGVSEQQKQQEAHENFINILYKVTLNIKQSYNAEQTNRLVDIINSLDDKTQEIGARNKFASQARTRLTNLIKNIDSDIKSNIKQRPYSEGSKSLLNQLDFIRRLKLNDTGNVKDSENMGEILINLAQVMQKDIVDKGNNLENNLNSTNEFSDYKDISSYLSNEKLDKYINEITIFTQQNTQANSDDKTITNISEQTTQILKNALSEKNEIAKKLVDKSIHQFVTVYNKKKNSDDKTDYYNFQMLQMQGAFTGQINSNYNNFRYHNLYGGIFSKDKNLNQLYNNYARNTLLYNQEVSKISKEESDLAEQTGIDFSKYLLEDIKNDRFSNPLKNNNDSLIQLSHEFNRKNLSKGNKQDIISAKELSSVIGEAIHRTYQQIYSKSRFDPDSKLLKALYQQAKQLEEEKQDLDDSIKNAELKKQHDLFKNIKSVKGFFTKALAMMGLGGLFSFHKWFDMVKDRANENGQMMYSNYLANASMGAPMSQNAHDLVFNMGQELFEKSYGQIGFNVPSTMYQNLASSVMNQPGRTGADKASDIMAFTKALVLPSQIYGLDNGTIASGINAFYYQNRMSAKQTIDMMMQVIGDANKAQIPVNRYMGQISQLVNHYRQLGYSGKQVVDNMGSLIADGYRMEDSASFVGQVIGAQGNFSQNKYNSIFSVLGGGAANMWQGMFANLKTHDRYGNPYADRQNYIGSQMYSRVRMVTDMFDNPIMKQFGVHEAASMIGGMNMKETQVLMNDVENGDYKKLAEHLEGSKEDELAKNQKATNATKDFTKQLEQVANQLSEVDKNKSMMLASANKLSDLLVGNNEGMQQFENIIVEGIKLITNAMASLLALIPEIKKFIEESPTLTKALTFASQNPLTALALAGLGLGGIKAFGKFTGKKVFEYAKNKLGHHNDVDHEQLAEENVKQQVESEKPKTELKNGKGFFGNLKSGLNKLKPSRKTLSSIGKGLKGFHGGGMLGSILTAGAIAGTMLLGSKNVSANASNNEDNAKQQEEQDDEQSINSMYTMFKTGNAKVTFYNKDGKLIDITGKNQLDSLLMQYGTNLFGVTIATIGISSIGKLAYDKYKQIKDLKMPKFPNVKMPKELSEKDLPKVDKLANPQETRAGMSTMDAVLTAIGLKSEMGNTKTKSKNKTKTSGKEEKLPKESGGALSKLLNRLMYIGAFAGEVLSDDDRSFGQKAVAGGIEAGSMWATFKLLDKTVGKIPKIGKPLAFLLPVIDGLAGTNYLSMVSEKLKALANVQAKYKEGNEEFLDKMNDQTGLTGASFEQLITSETAQGEYFRSYLEANGIEYGDLNEQEKLFFKLQIDELAFSQLSVAKVLAYAIHALQVARTTGNLNLNGNENGNKQLTEKGKEYIKNQLEAFFPGDDNEITNLDMAIHTYVYTQDYVNEHESEFDYDKKSAAYATLRYLKHRIVELNGGEPYELTDEDNVGLLGEKSYIVIDPYDNPTGRSGSSEEFAEKLSNLTGYVGYISAEEIKEGIGNTAEEDKEIAKSAGFYGAAMGNYEDSLTKQLINDNNPEYVEDKSIQQNPNPVPNVSNANIGAYASMVEQAKMISRLTGLPADVIFAQLAFETGQNPSDMAYSDKIHNYGGTVVDMGHGQNASGFGIYVNNQEGAEAYVKGTVPVREQLPQLKEAIAQGDLKKYVHLLKYGMEESGKGKYQYFTGDENEYLNGIMSYLSLAHKLGLNGVIPNGTFDFSNYTPRTLKEQAEENLRKYKVAVGNGKEMQGAIINGLYIDTNRPFQSVETIGAKLRASFLDGSYDNDPNKVYQEMEAINKNNIKKMVESTTQQIKQTQEQQKALQQSAQQTVEMQNKQKQAEQTNVCSLNVMGQLKQGIKETDVLETITKIAQKYGVTTDVKAQDVVLPSMA